MMADRCGSQPKRAEHIERIIEDDLERRYGFPSGVLRQGRITHWPSDSKTAVWTAEGGVVACRDAELAGILARIITEHEGDHYAALLSGLQQAVSKIVPSASCSMYAFGYCGSPISPKGKADEQVEMLRPYDLHQESFRPETEHVFAIRDDLRVTARAWNLPRGEAASRQFHAIGVYVRREHRGRGLAKAVLSALLQDIASEGGVALWSADVTNLASLRLARSVGFVDHVFKFSWEIGNGA